MTATCEELIRELGGILRKAREWSLSMGGLHALMVLQGEDDMPLPSGEIATQLGTSKEAGTSLINTLENAGLVCREYGAPHDGRMVLISLTPRGKKAVDYITGKEGAQ